jgi:hypothetical protein
MKFIKLLVAVLFSTALFSTSKAQTVTITAPNGGEVLYACQSYTITWSQTGSPSNYWDIDYSSNGGTTWTSVASNLLSATGQFVWTVPNLQSSTVIMRIKDATNGTVVDMSNSNFTINIPVTVTAPNGGESWTAGTTQSINWIALGTSGTFNISYSVNGGSSWISIVSNYATGSGTYSWTVPNNPSTFAMVRVQDAVTGCMIDASNSTFTILAAQPILLTPNGGETLYINCIYNITWNTSTFYTTVKLEYSTNAGATWVTIVSSASNSGSYNWTVPNTAATSCLVRASNSSDATSFDVSNAVFTIAPSVTVVSPNGSENLVGCSNYVITWNKTTCVGNWNIAYSTNNGATWNNIVTNLGNTASNSQSYTWYVPNNLTSTQALIRVESYSSPGTYSDVSNAVFNITPNSNITLTTPNGGESWVGCSSYNIVWTKLASPCNSGYDLYYSLNNGTSWNYITSVTDNSLASQTYTWSVPNTLSSTQCLIQVRSSNWSNITDQSNAVFTITPSADITVTSANGGEVWQGLSSQVITWTNLPAASGLYTVQYSTNNGSSWNTLVTNYSGNSYTWATVPNTPSTTCLIRVTDYLTPCKYDQSNAVFTISPATPIMTAPNGGNTFNVGCNTNITWNTSTYYSTINLYYSTNGGSTYTTIATNLSNNGVYTWTVPNAVSANCLIKVANSADITVFDVSDAVFTIAVPLTVTAANGGESWAGCNTYNITWTKSTCVGNWNIYYSTNNGSTWNTIVTNLANTGTATQSYAWQVPNTITTTQALIRVESYSTPAIVDQSDAVFNIAPSNDITVVTPNGGETIAATSTYAITWTNLAGASGQYTIQYSTNNGSSWSTVATNVTGNSYNWSVPNTSSTTCLVRVLDYLNTCKNDVSNAVFTITPSGPVLLTPNGGETLYISCTYTITWAQATFFSNVMLEYSTNNGATWLSIIASTTNDGSHNWTVPNTVSSNCLIRASNTADVTLFDVSDAVFVIAPAVTVTSPNGGETLTGCSTHTITWTKSTCVGNWNILYSTNNGSTWTTIVSNYANSGTNSQSYNWYVPNNLTSTQGLIRVESTSSPSSYFDVSNAAFTFAPNNNITVVSPNGGEVWAGCSSYNITWTKMVAPCNTSFDLYYSLNNGTTWNYITNVVDNGLASQTYTWAVPNTLNSTTCLIQVRSGNWSNITDASNAVLTIAPSADITVTSANGGEVWQGLSSHLITWTNLPAASGLYTVQYSTNNGGSWTTLVTNYSGNSYNWLSVPNTPSTTCLIKVIDYLVPCKFDVSDANFTISPATPIMTAPNGGQVFNVGCNTTITWTASTYYSNINLYYSIDNGVTWVTIATNQSNSGSYTWAVPNAPSGNCLVKVANSLDVTVFDISDANFTINVPVTVVSANGGEAWLGCSTYAITWTHSLCVGNWNIAYSINGGATWTALANNVTNAASPQTYNWQIPNNITTTQALIRVESSTYTSAMSDVSDAMFSITPSNDITVITPNGGEVISSLTTYNISWSNTPSASGQYTLQYSTNNGASYTTIVSNITGNSYNWSVPNLSSSQCLIRVLDFVNTCKNDASDAVFTITPPQPILLTPNGGETMYIACSYNITWNQSTFISTVNLEYSTNNGATWLPIVNGTANDGTHFWTVPNTQSANCRVRASNSIDVTIFDISDAVFTIAPAVQVVTPNGGETLTGCSNYAITWNKSTCVGNWNILYSLNNGSTWTTIVSNLSNTAASSQTYNWYVPNNLTTTLGLIRVESQSSPGSYNDQSNAVFTINPSNNIVLSTPNGGESWTTCLSYNITWTKSIAPCNTAYDLYYSTNNGTSWNYITNVVDNGLANQTYSWTIPNTVPNTTQALIRVVSSTWSNIMDQSNAVFTINQNADITVVTPNGGQVWQGLSTQTITWTNSIYASGLYTVQYSINGGSTWNTIVTNYSGNSYTWSVPNTPSTNCLIKVLDYLATCRFDNSNATFTISPATPILITPNGGEILNAGQTYGITWNTTTYYSNVNLYYSVDNGATYTTIATNQSNSGSYTWTVPNANSSNCRVKVANLADVTVFDVSDAVFTIKPAVKIVTPNGGEILGGCTVTSITWERSPSWNTYRIEYSANNGATWVIINSSYATAANPATYTWTVPNIASTTALVRVSPTLALGNFDQSDAVFTLSRPVTIIQPNFGGTMTVGSSYNITWNSDGISNLYDIFYSVNGGSTFTNIVTAYNTTTNSYSWTVPNNPSVNCKIWVRDNTNTCKQDTSDVVFTISSTPAPITLLTPNGGETLSGCFPYNITWTDSPTIGTYDLQYSTNSGTTWNTIINGYVTSTHNYNWNIPNTINSSTCLIRVRSTASPSVFDQSDALLAINFGNLSATPADTTVCAGQTVQLNAVNGYNYTWTPAAGLSCTSCANPVATPMTTTTYTVTSNNAGCILTDTVHVNVFTASVAIAASPATTICAGTSVTFTATPTNGGTTPAYQWYLNGGPVGTNSPTYTTTTLANNDQVYVVLTSNAPCLVTNTATSSTITMNVISIPATPASISGSTPVCSGSSNTYSIVPVAGATTYTWTLPGAWTGTSTTSSITSTASTTSGNVTVTAGNTCGTSAAQTLAVTVNVIPSTPGAIAGPGTICSGTSNTYSVTAVAGATSYTWTMPGGWTGTSTTNSITATASTTSGNITVTANNACGNSAAQTFAVIVNTTPATPGTITGTTPICAGTTNTYSITSVAGATSYTWTTPTGWSGTSTTNSITATADATSGNVTVTANNGCGSSSAQTLAVVVNSIPAMPGTISGPATLCQGTSNTYSVTAVSGATSYTWSMPSGWTGTSASNSITSTASATSGNISVTASNACGTSSAQVLAATVNPLPTVTAGGTATICAGQSTTLSATGGATYSWSPAAGLSDPNISNPVATPATTTTYTVSGTSADGCTSTATVTITVTPGPVVTVSSNTSICQGSSTSLSASGATTYSWTPAAGLSDPNISNPVATPTTTTTYTVTGTTGLCSTSATVTITVNPVPVVSASGTATICSGSSTPLSATGATTYNWSPSTGLSSATIANPVASPTVTTTYTVTGTSLGCSSTATVTVTVNTITASAGADASICPGGSTTLLASGGTSYAWSPATGLSATNIANPVANPSSTTNYTVTVTSGSCSATDVVTVTVNPFPSANAGSDVTIPCGGNTTLSASGGTSYAWSPSTGLSSTTIANPVANPSVTTTYSVTVTNGGCSASDAVTVTVGTLVANAGPDQTTCSSGSGVILNGSSTGGATSGGGWVSALGFGNSGASYGKGIAVDNAGNRYLVGDFTGTMSFGSFNLTSTGSNDIYIMKISPAGTVLWANKAGGTAQDVGNDITLDAAGNVYITGYFTGTGTFNSVNLVSSGSSDAFVAKYNSSGVIQWAQKGGGTGADVGQAIAVNGTNVWITGEFAGTASIAGTSLTAVGSSDMFVGCYTSAGTGVWSARGGGNSTTYTDAGYDVVCDALNNVYVCGYFSGINAAFSTLTVSSAGGSDHDAFVAKYNSSGAIQWIKDAGNSTYGENFTSMAIDGAGNIYCSGAMQGTVAYGPFSVTSAGNADAPIVKYNSAGVEQFAVVFGGTSTEGLGDLMISPTTGNIVAAGAGFSPSMTVGSTTLTGFNSSGNVFVAEIDRMTGAGISAIKSSSSSPGGDQPSGIGGDGNGNYYIAGSFGIGAAAVTFGSTTLTTAGSMDNFEAKLSLPVSGSYVWSPSTGLSCTACAAPTANPSTTTTYVLTVTNGSCSDTDTVTVTVGTATANAGSDVTICSGASTTLTATGGTTYSWSPAAGLSSTTVANPVANPTTTTSYTVTATTGSCSATDVVVVTVNPTPVANAGADQTISCGASTTLSGSGGGTYSWSPATGLSNPNIANPVCTPSTTTTYTLTVSNGTCSSTDQVTITTGTLTANAGPDVTICSGSSTPLSGSSTGGGSSYVNLATSYSFAQAVNTYTPITGGTVFLNGGSPSMDDVVSSAIAIPAFSFNNITYTSIYISTNGFITFGTAPTSTNYDPIGSTETYAGAVAGFGTDVNKATTGTPEIRYQTVGTEFVVQYRDVGRYNSGGTLDRLSFQIRLNTVGNTVKVVYDNPALIGAATFDPEVGLRGPNNVFTTNVHNRLVVSTTGPWVNSTQGTTNTSVCFIDSSVPATKPSAGTTFTWTPSTAATTTYSWSPPTGLTCTTCTSPVATPTTTTTYTFTATNGSCTAVDMVAVTVGTSNTNAGADVSICTGSSTTMNATGATTYSWSPATGLSATNIANPVASPTTTTTYTVTGTTGSCVTTDVVVVTVTPMPVANAGSDVTICSGSSTTLNASGGTTYSWSPAAGLSSTTIANPVATPTATTTYTVTVSNGTCSSTDVVVVTVNPAPVANAGSDVAICAGGSTALSASGGTTYSWLPATGLSSTTVANPTATPAATTSYTVTVSNGTCSATDVVVVTVNTVVTSAGPDVTICTGGSTTLAASGATTYSWSPATGLSSTTSASPVASPATTTTYTVTGTTGSCSSTDVITVTVVSPPTANAGSDATICLGSSTTLAATGGTSYSWSPAAGLSSTTIANPVANPTTTTTYTVTVSNGTCSSTDMVTVTVNPGPTANAGSDVSICAGGSTTLTASGGTSYAWSPATGLSSATIANPVATPTATTSYTVTVTSAGCSATDIVVVTVNSVTASAGSDVSICSGASTTLTASGGTSYSWSPAAGLSSATIANPVANPTTTTTYTVTVSNGTCSATDFVTVTVNASPVANAGADATICTGSSTTLSASGGGSYSWSPATGLSNPSIANPVANPGTTTSYTVTVSNGTCSSTDVVDVIVVSPPAADAGTDASICSGGNTTLNATGGTSYTWIPATGLSATNIANPVASPASTTTYTVIVSNGSCSATDFVTVNVNSAPVAPASISGPASVCAGSTNTYSVAVDPNISSYSWILPGGWSGSSTTNTLNATANSSSGVVLVTASNACGSASPVTLNITVNALPTVTMAPLGNVCDNAAPFTLTAGSPAGGIYSGTGVVSGTSFSPPVAGPGTWAITYVYIDGNGCSASASDNIIVDFCTDVNALSSETGGVWIYPNPFNSFTNVHINENITLKGASIIVFDMLGKNVINITDIQTYDVKIERTDLQAGSYFYQFINENKVVQTGKLIIN